MCQVISGRVWIKLDIWVDLQHSGACSRPKAGLALIEGRLLWVVSIKLPPTCSTQPHPDQSKLLPSNGFPGEPQTRTSHPFSYVRPHSFIASASPTT